MVKLSRQELENIKKLLKEHDNNISLVSNLTGRSAWVVSGIRHGRRDQEKIDRQIAKYERHAQKAVEMRKCGFTLREIAKELGVSTIFVSRRLREAHFDDVAHSRGIERATYNHRPKMCSCCGKQPRSKYNYFLCRTCAGQKNNYS